MITRATRKLQYSIKFATFSRKLSLTFALRCVLCNKILVYNILRMITRVTWKLQYSIKFATFSRKLSLTFALRCVLCNNILVNNILRCQWILFAGSFALRHYLICSLKCIVNLFTPCRKMVPSSGEWPMYVCPYILTYIYACINVFRGFPTRMVYID